MQTLKANPLGEARAELDHAMLDDSFYEWQDYRILFESADRFVVVGRRGTGKSALTYRLSKDWQQQQIHTIVIAPTEEEVIGLRPLASELGKSVSRIRAGIKLAWRYAVLMEIALHLQNYYKTKAEFAERNVLVTHTNSWRNNGTNAIQRVRQVLRGTGRNIQNPEERIADLPKLLQINRLSEDVSNIVEKHGLKFVLIIDRLDEGYEPDTVGVAIVDGIVYGVDELRSTLGSYFRPIVFLRDNIFRALQSEDKDFSRNLESQVMYLHWDPQELFYMVTKRIRAALHIERESDVKVWNAITSNELQGREGFKSCLKLTLYRPRDLISLLNTAFYQAQRQRREVLIQADFEESAKKISDTRFDDLLKEYESVFPGIRQLTLAFASGPSKFRMGYARKIIESVSMNPNLEQAATQHLKILGTPEEVVKGLYGIGFLGLQNSELRTFVFSHDGKNPGREFGEESLMMVHPCFWIALNMQKEDIGATEAEEIFDEYEISVTSYSVQQRKHLLGQIISQLNAIPEGDDGAAQFEEWCKDAIEIAFAKQLVNVQLKPNRSATQRRDIVATNQALSGFWKRIREDYSTRIVTFEIKNYRKISVEEYRQVYSYLGKEYGKLGLIVCRDPQAGLVKGQELEAFREFYGKDHVILKLTASTLVNILSKLRSPEKVDIPNQMLERSLDTHITLYASGQVKKHSKKRVKR